MTQELAVGIDIGGTNTKIGLVGRDGTIIAKGGIATTGHESLEAYVTAIKETVKSLAGDKAITGVGIGAPNGNFFTGEIKFAPNLPWKGVLPMANLISKALGVKATLTNDAKAAAIGEMIFGAAKGLKDFILITLGTGLGSGFVANGQLIYGHDGFAGELGHIIAVRGGRRCGCGRDGCLETYVSATGIVRTAQEWLASNPDARTTLRQQGNDITAETINAAALQGDTMALDLFAYTGKILGETLADAVTITSPEAIILFGGLANAGELLFSHVRTHFEMSLLNVYKDKIKVIPSALNGSDAAILGAAALVW